MPVLEICASGAKNRLASWRCWKLLLVAPRMAAGAWRRNCIKYRLAVGVMSWSETYSRYMKSALRYEETSG